MDIMEELFKNKPRRAKVIIIKSNKICMLTHLRKIGYNDFQN